MAARRGPVYLEIGGAEANPALALQEVPQEKSAKNARDDCGWKEAVVEQADRNEHPQPDKASVGHLAHVAKNR